MLSPMKLLLIRHGESKGNAIGDYIPPAHDTLSATGLTQAVKLVDRLVGWEFAAAYCSPLQRAIETIIPYAQSSGCSVEIWPELAEACWQDERDEAAGAKPRYQPSAILERLNLPRFHFRGNAAIRPVDDEIYGEGMARVYTAAGLLRERHMGREDTILVVSHGHFITRLIELLLGMSPTGRFHHANTGMSLLSEEKGRFTADFINRT